MRKGRKMNKLLPWRRDKHLLFHEGTAIALQERLKMKGKGKRWKLEEIKWAVREEVHDCQDQSVSNAKSIPIKMLSVYVFLLKNLQRIVYRGLNDHNQHQALIFLVGSKLHFILNINLKQQSSPFSRLFRCRNNLEVFAFVRPLTSLKQSCCNSLLNFCHVSLPPIHWYTYGNASKIHYHSIGTYFKDVLK